MNQARAAVAAARDGVFKILLHTNEYTLLKLMMHIYAIIYLICNEQYRTCWIYCCCVI